jgi:hypothetical protein
MRFEPAYERAVRRRPAFERRSGSSLYRRESLSCSTPIEHDAGDAPATSAAEIAIGFITNWSSSPSDASDEGDVGDDAVEISHVAVEVDEAPLSSVPSWSSTG